MLDRMHKNATMQLCCDAAQFISNNHSKHMMHIFPLFFTTTILKCK